MCRRCAACQVCGRADGDGDKLRCGKCLKASHSDCLQPSQRETIPGQDGGDESWVRCYKYIHLKYVSRTKCKLNSSGNQILKSNLWCSSLVLNKIPALQTCFQCLRCKSCGKSDVSHYLDGTPLCAVCCLQTKKGSYCPLCSGCYDDDDYDTRMMGEFLGVAIRPM